MGTRYVLGLAVAVGLLVGVGLSYAPTADASRNSSGSYSLPSGNPVTSGTTITSTWANTTLADLGAEVTNSLDRQGRGAMLAPLQLSAGTSSAPALTFSAEPTSGLYRAGAGDTRMQVQTVQTQKWTASAVTFPVAVVTQAGVTATTSVSNGAALTGTGTGSGAGASGTGGASSGAGLTGTGGASNGNGVVGQGTGTGSGISGTGGTTSGPGGTFVGGAPNGPGVAGFGTGTGVGGAFTGAGTAAGASVANGTAATGGTRQTALIVSNGDVSLSGVTNPTSTTAVSKTLTPKNLVSVWALATTNGAGAVAVGDGFNLTSAAVTAGANGFVRFTFASAFASANYACTATADAGDRFLTIKAQTTTTVDVQAYDVSFGGVLDPSTTAVVVHLHCVGAQ